MYGPTTLYINSFAEGRKEMVLTLKKIDVFEKEERNSVSKGIH